jgi:MFS family permease
MSSMQKDVVSTQARSDASNEQNEETKKDWRFWVVFLSCCFLALLVSLDGTVVVIALPRIANDLHLGDDYVWAANSFWLACTVFQPLCAQLCDIFGRKSPLLVSLAIFFVGGLVAGVARTGATLIAGRAVQGIGSGGIFLLMEVVVCDIISLRERGKYLSIVFSTAAIGAIIGPPIGGAIANHNWRWIFFMNLPISAAVFLVMALCMRMKYTRESTWRRALSRVDWVGTTLFSLSITSLLLGLVLGGIMYPWNSWHIIVPIVLGILGWAAFHVYEGSKFCSNPAVPGRLFGNRTSVAGFAMIFLQSMMTTWIAFEWPLFFQGVLQTSPLGAGIKYIAFEAFLIPAAGVSGQLVTKTGHYRLIQFVGFTLLTLGFGLNILLDAATSTVKWVCLIAVNAVGLGLLLPTMLPAILASLPEGDVAIGTGVYSFLRSLGYIWGVTAPATIFNASFDRFSWKISNMGLQQSLGRGKAYQYVSGELVRTLSPFDRAQVLDVYVESLRVAWEVAVAFSAVGLVLVLIEKHVPLRTKVNQEYGLETKDKEEQGKQDGK